MAMTPHVIASKTCANWAKGGCLGVSVADLAQEKRPKTADPLDECPIVADPQDVCLLAQDPPAACAYFALVCLPLADWPSPKSDPTRQRRYIQARELYREAFDGGKPGRGCCDCGGVMPKGSAACKRYCDACGAKRRRITFRNEKRRQRKGAGGVLQNAPANPLEMRA